MVVVEIEVKNLELWGKLFYCVNLLGSKQNIDVKWQKRKPISEKGWRHGLRIFYRHNGQNIHKPGLKVFFLCCYLLSLLRNVSRQHCIGSNEGEETQLQTSFPSSQVSSLISSTGLWRGQLNSVKLYSNCLVNQFIVQFVARNWKKQVSAALMFKFLWKEARH